MDKNTMKLEAIKRMTKLNLMEEVIQAFVGGGENSLYYSERQNKQFPAVLYWVDNEPKYQKIIKDFEEKYEGLVYHAILTHTSFGDLLDLLYVSKHEEEWEMDNEDLDGGYVMVYSNNLDDDMCTEFGSIAIRPVMGGLERIG